MTQHPRSSDEGPTAARTFTATCERGPAGPVVVLRGELDLAAGPELERAVRSAWPFLRRRGDGASDPGAVVRLDVSGVRFVDVAGLRHLRELDARASAAGAVLHLAGVGPGVRRVMGWCQWSLEDRCGP